MEKNTDFLCMHIGFRGFYTPEKWPYCLRHERELKRSIFYVHDEVCLAKGGGSKTKMSWDFYYSTKNLKVTSDQVGNQQWRIGSTGILLKQLLQLRST